MHRYIEEPINFTKAVVKEFSEDGCSQWAAALAYYTAFSLPPLLVLVVSIAGIFVGPERVRSAIEGEVQTVVSDDGADAVGEMVEKAGSSESRSWFAMIAGFGALVFGATGAMAQLQSALNRVWEVEPDESRGGVLNFLFKRIFSFGMIIVIAFLLLVSLMLSTILASIGATLASWLPTWVTASMLFITSSAASLLIVTVLFAVMLQFLPDVRIAWKDVLVGALFTALLFSLGKWGLGVYLGNSSVGSNFGQAKSLALILLWVYYSSMIVLLGAEFTQVWARRYGSMVEPSRGAVRVVHEKKQIRQSLGEREPSTVESHGV